MSKLRLVPPRHFGLGLGVWLLGTSLVSAPAWAAEELLLDESGRSQLQLTLYQQNLALVEEQRDIPLLAAGTRVVLQGVSPQTQAETLQIAGAGRIQEQSLEQNLLGLHQLLQQHSGATVSIARFNSVTGTETRQSVRLLKAEGNQLLIENAQGQIETLPLNHSGWRIIFPAPAEGYRLKPRLSFVSEGLSKPGQVKLRYLTQGLSWSMDYVVNMDASGNSLDLQGLATLSNQSGLAWPDAGIKLLAGKVNQPVDYPRQEAVLMARAPAMDKAGGASAPGSVQDYHLYTLPQTLTLNDQQQKQIPLINRTDIPASIRYYYQFPVTSHQQLPPQQDKASIQLSFKAPMMESEKTPLPTGQVRVFRPDADQQLQFIGGSHLQATAPGDKAELTLGEAFDLGVEYTQTAFRKVFDGFEVSYEVKLTNRSQEDKPFDLSAQMPMPFSLLQSSLKPAGQSAARIEWAFDLEAGEERVLTFSAKLIRS